MAKRKKTQRKRKSGHGGHVRLNCPHCGRDVSVQRPSAFQRTMPCTNCRIPIASEFIIAASEGTNESTPPEEAGNEDNIAQESSVEESETA